MQTEEVILVDEHDNITGYKLRSKLTLGDRWRICGAVVFDTDGKTLIAQRSAKKKSDPLKWGPGVAGTLTKGETYLECVVRETEEELGIICKKPQELYRGAMQAPDGNKRYCVWYKVVVDKGTKITLQPEEVSSYKWVEIDWLTKDLLKNPSNYLSETITWSKILQSLHLS